MYSHKMTVKVCLPKKLFRTMVNMINHELRCGTSDFDLKNKLKGYIPPRDISGFLTVVKAFYMLDKVKDKYILHPAYAFVSSQFSNRHGSSTTNNADDTINSFIDDEITANALVVEANDIITASAFNNLDVRSDLFDRKWITMILSNLGNNDILPLTSGTERGITTYRDCSNYKTSFITRKFFTKANSVGWALTTDVTTETVVGKNKIATFAEVNKYGFYYGNYTTIETIDFHSIMKAPNLIDVILTFMSDKGFRVKF